MQQAVPDAFLSGAAVTTSANSTAVSTASTAGSPNRRTGSATAGCSAAAPRSQTRVWRPRMCPQRGRHTRSRRNRGGAGCDSDTDPSWLRPWQRRHCACGVPWYPLPRRRRPLGRCPWRGAAAEPVAVVGRAYAATAHRGPGASAAHTRPAVAVPARVAVVTVSVLPVDDKRSITRWSLANR